MITKGFIIRLTPDDGRPSKKHLYVGSKEVLTNDVEKALFFASDLRAMEFVRRARVRSADAFPEAKVVKARVSDRVRFCTLPSLAVYTEGR